MLNTYVLHRPAEYHGQCHNCDQEYIPGELIYWHGRLIHAKHLSPTSHEGCFWDSLKHGPAPHLTWQQVEAINLAVTGEKLPDDKQVRRLIGAVRNNLKRRAAQMYRGDKDAGLRMGPGLLEGYRAILKATGKAKDPWWYPVEVNGSVKWVNPEKAQEQPERPPLDEAANIKAYREKHYRAAR